MKRDLRSVVKQVASFLDKSITNEQMEQLIKHLSFDSMKENPAVNFTHRFKGHEHPFMRKGVIGDYENKMSPEIIKQFDDWISKNNPGIEF